MTLSLNNSNKDFDFVGWVIKTSRLIYLRSVNFHYVKETHMMLVALVKIAHLHDDVTRAKSSGSCSQIRGLFWIAMAPKDNNSVDKARKLGSCRVILTEEDIPGASLQ